MYSSDGENVFRSIKTSVCGLLLAMCGLAAGQTESMSVFSSLDGKPEKMESHTGNGRWLVVMIWASDCHICNTEAKTYDQFYRSRHDTSVSVLGISIDGEEKNAAARQFVNRHKLSFPNLIGEPGMVGLYFSALTKESLRGTPTFMVFDPNGDLAAVQAGAVPPESIDRFIERKRAARPEAR